MLKSFLGALVLASLMASSPAFAQEAKTMRSIEITGHGESHVVPDIAVITLGVTTSAQDAKVALAGNTKSMTALMAELKATNIADKDVMTSNFSVQPRYDYGQNTANNPPRIVGYDVSNTVVVTLRNIDTMGALLDKVVQSGSNQISGISFAVKDPQKALDEAREDAVKDATRKATLLTAAAEVKLGKVTSISESVNSAPAPEMMVREMKADAAAAPVPVSRGEQVLSANVHMVWEIE